MSDYRNLIAYKKAYELAMDIFEVTKTFPKEERFELTSQIRRSSRSVCANLAESMKRSRYIAHYSSKLNDSETENAETQVHIDFSLSCKYITTQKHQEWTTKNNDVGNLLVYMINNPEKFI